MTCCEQIPLKKLNLKSKTRLPQLKDDQMPYLITIIFKTIAELIS